MANGMYGREELSPVIGLFLGDGDALCRVPVIPEIYPKPSHHSRLRMDLRRAVGVDGFPSLRYILINDFLMRLRHRWTIHVFFAFPGPRVAEPGGDGWGWLSLGCCRFPVSLRDAIARCMSRTSGVGRVGAGCSYHRGGGGGVTGALYQPPISWRRSAVHATHCAGVFID